MYNWNQIAGLLHDKYQCGWYHAKDTVDLAIKQYGEDKAFSGLCRLLVGNISWDEAFAN
jgi:hypothetical protein